MNLSLSKPTRKDKIKGWLAEHGLTFRKIGKAVGMSDVGARKSLLSETVTLSRYEAFKDVGIPEDLLPKPRPVK